MIKDLIKKNRSYRRFDNSHKIDDADLRELIDLARFSASASNRQLLRFYLSSNSEDNAKVFSCLKWAGYLTDWDGPNEEERPSAYIVILKPNQNAPYTGHDTGIASQSILLGAVEKGLGGCMFASIDRERLHKLLKLPSDYQIELVIAIGKPVEIVEIDEWDKKSIRYWRDTNKVHHVPKLNIEDLIIKKH